MNSRYLLPVPVVLSAALTFALFPACDAQDRNYGNGGSAGMGASSSSSGTLGPCTSSDQCGANGECQTFACVDGHCMVSFTANGTLISQQAVGNCKSSICDGKGYVVNIPDPMDPVDDGNPCSADSCDGFMPMYTPVAAGETCNGTFFCNGAGNCVECLMDAHCSNAVCFKGQCVLAQCSDGQPNGGETDADCGGPQCPPCAPGLKCGVDKDCNSILCQNGVCAAPTCMDGLPNGLETGTDCGGPDCPPCGTGSPCKASLDCASRVCTGNICQDPACDDNVTNGDETDVDCGGTVCTKCANGRSCLIYKDCMSGDCCVPDPAMPGYCQPAGSMCNATLRSESAQ